MWEILVSGALVVAPLVNTSQKKDPNLHREVEARVHIVERWAADPLIVQAVRKANERPRTVSDIERLDTQWQESTGVDEFMRTIIENPAADRLRELRRSNPELQEAFVTDRLGANVASTNKTSDFFQGDETKFSSAYNDGAGAIHIGELSRDESIGSYSIPIGAPVMDDGAAIGVLVVTVNVEKLKR